LAFVRVTIGGVNVGHTRFRYPRATREPLPQYAVMIRESSTLAGSYFLLTTVVSNTATSPTAWTLMETPPFTVQ
jgi:hypothetical protein